MKKISKLTLFVLVILGVACSKSEDNNNGSNSSERGGFNSGDFRIDNHFPKKQVRENISITGTWTNIYEITNGKIEKVSYSYSDSYGDNKKKILTYEYEGNLLKRVKTSTGTIEKEFSYANGKLVRQYDIEEGTREIEYNNEGKISKIIRYYPRGSRDISEYTYVDDSTIKMIFNGKYQHIYTFVNGNLVKEQNSLGTITYQYDNKNNWKYNNNLEMTTDVLSYLNEEFCKNNPIKIVFSSRGKLGNIDDGEYEEREITYNYEYNSEGYVTKVIKNDAQRIMKTYEY